MALQNINIDDRNFDQLLKELKQHIPVEKWTDHNPSDPGIMLLELLAWLGEMTLYTMNTVPDAHHDKFLKLIADPPEPVTLQIQLDIPVIDGKRDALEIPPGVRFATDFKDGQRYVFETYKKTTFPQYTEASGKEPEPIIIDTRNWKKITGEVIGITGDAPNQTFSLKPGQYPVLLDFVNKSPDYQPNPVIHTDQPVNWQLKQFLLTEDSRIENDEKHYHFMVDAHENTIRFGDNKYGSIPVANDTLTCDYQVIQGKEALIKAGEIKHILKPPPDFPMPEDTTGFIISSDAMSDLYFMEKENRLAKGLENFKKPYRLITDQDFEHALINDFNTLQELTRRNPFNRLLKTIREDGYDIRKLWELNENNMTQTLQQLYHKDGVVETAGKSEFQVLVDMYFEDLNESLLKIYRVSPLINHRYIVPAGPLAPQTGHITLLVIPEFDPVIPASQNQIDVPGPLRDKILHFLDKRRLITTRLHIMPAQLKRIHISIIAVIFKERHEDQMRKTIRTHILNFMDILNGGHDKKGWPTGGDVYKSHLYRLVEDIEGVDYVKSLSFGIGTGTNVIPIGENQLPLLPFDNLTVNVERQ